MDVIMYNISTLFYILLLKQNVPLYYLSCHPDMKVTAAHCASSIWGKFLCKWEILCCALQMDLFAII